MCYYAKRGFVLTSYGVTLHNSLHPTNLLYYLKDNFRLSDLKPYSLDDGCLQAHILILYSDSSGHRTHYSSVTGWRM